MSDIHLSQQLVFHSVKPYQVAVRALPSRLDIQPQVDLRPTINVLSLAVRNQNSRGTCSVFALTFLLEYLYGTRLALPVNDLSEEYLNYVANLVSGNNGDGDFFQNLNAGYQAWGIVPERDLPYQSTPVTTVAQAILDAGRLWTRFEADFIKPWDSSKGASQQQLDQAIAYLDKNIPVAFGGWWFKAGNWSTTLIKDVEVMDVPPVSQKNVVVEDGHSVALVGYRKDVDFPGGGYFIFRNSWGVGFGDQGYGYMPFEYVQRFANDLVAYTLTDATSSKIGSQAVVAHADKLDVFITDNTANIRGAAWQQAILDGHWRGWWPILGGKAPKGALVTAIARDPNKLDLFVAGLDGKTYSAAWDRNVSNAQWRGWWNILTGNVPAGGVVSAVSRDPEKLDIFLISTDGGIYTAAWDAQAANGAWRGWWRILNGVGKPGAPVAAVSRDPHKLDIFVAGMDGKVYSAAWDAQAANGAWRGWWPILNGNLPSGGTITAVSRDANKLDLFMVGTDGGIYTAAWDAQAANGAWRGWWRILNGVAKPGAPVAAVSRDPHKLDIFVIGTDGGIYTAAWDAQVANGAWRGWWRILNGVAELNGGIATVSRDLNKLDVFVVGTDGGIYTAAWDAQVANGAWRGWWRINS